MRTKLALLLGLTSLLIAGVAAADDESDIMALIHEYSDLNAAGDMMAQAKLMTDDRIMIAGRRRRTDQANNMAVQQAGQERLKRQNPGAKVFVTATDPIVKVHGDAAAASFYWYTDVVLSPEDEGPNPPTGRVIVSLFLVKQANMWKIAHTHISPMDPSN